MMTKEEFDNLKPGTRVISIRGTRFIVVGHTKNGRVKMKDSIYRIHYIDNPNYIKVLEYE